MDLFVTGNDTEVGKSVVTACLAQAARADGRHVVAAKPVASGVPEGEAGEDASLLADAAGHPPLVAQTFRTPVSPHRAARLEGRPVEVERLEAWVRGLRGDPVLVEGVGGWKVPVSDSPWVWVADLARWHGAPVVVVAADRLGCLNHTLLTVDAVQRDGLKVVTVALVAGAPDPEDVSTSTNLEDLREMLNIPVVSVPRIDVDDPEQRERVGRCLWETILARTAEEEGGQ